MVIWIYTGEVSAKRIREKYLQAVLRQDIAYFDTVGAGEVATRIQTDTRMSPPSYTLALTYPILPDLVQQGMSEKVAHVVSFISAFITGFVLAYARSWRLALAISAILPCIAIVGGLTNKFTTRFMQSVSCILFSLLPANLSHRISLKHVASGGTLAEEAISSIRTAHAFGTQKTLTSLYDIYIQESRLVDTKSAIYHGAGLGLFFFITYSAYALGGESCP